MIAVMKWQDNNNMSCATIVQITFNYLLHCPSHFIHWINCTWVCFHLLWSYLLQLHVDSFFCDNEQHQTQWVSSYKCIVSNIFLCVIAKGLNHLNTQHDANREKGECRTPWVTFLLSIEINPFCFTSSCSFSML